MAAYNARAMFHSNGTQSFTSRYLAEVDDDKYIKKIARQEDSSRKERKRKDELLHGKEIVEVKRRNLQGWSVTKEEKALGPAIEYYNSRSIHTNLIHGDDNNLKDVDMIIITADDYDTDCSMED